MLPGSTIFSVTTPSNGAAMRENVSVVSAASLAAFAPSTAADGGPRARRRAGGPRFRRAEDTRHVVELLRGGRALGVQAGDARMRRARQGERGVGRLALGLCGNDVLIGRDPRRARTAGLGGEVAAVEHDQHLAGTDAVARATRGPREPARRSAP